MLGMYMTGLGGTYRVPVRLRSLATAEVAKSPGSIAKHAQLTAVAQESQQRTESTLGQDIVPALWAVTSDVTQGPDGLLTDVGLWATEKLNENGDGTGLNDDLCLSRTT